MYETTYHRASSVAEAASLFAKGKEAKYLAGGQTLLPVMKQRLASPSDVIDLTKIGDLVGCAGTLSGIEIKTLADARRAAKIIHGFGCKHVLIKGGHLAAERATDLLYDGRFFNVFKGEFIDTPHTHGTGCTFASAIAPKGQEASYGALSYIPFLLAKLLIGTFSGALLVKYCPASPVPFAVADG